MRSARFSTLTAALCLTAQLGCSSSKAVDGGAAGGPSMAGSAGMPAVCTAPGYHVDAPPISVTQVSALLVDPSGAPVPHLAVQLCGVNDCTYAYSDGAGKASLGGRLPLVLPAFKYGSGEDFAELAAPIESGPSVDLGRVVALPLPSYADGAAFGESGPVTNGELTLHIAAGTNVDIDELTYPDAVQQVFRSVPVPLADSERAVPPSFGFELAFGVAPILTKFCPAAPLSVNNSLAWDPGTEVEVFVQGLEANEAWAPYGTWVKVADAAVSSDGTSIDTTSGGIPILSAIALRRK